MDIGKAKQILEGAKEFNFIEMGVLIEGLLESGALKFPEFVNAYVKHISKKEDEQRKLSMLLAHRLAIKVMKSKNSLDENTRKIMYENKLFKGSQFGDKLEKEFSNKEYFSLWQHIKK